MKKIINFLLLATLTLPAFSQSRPNPNSASRRFGTDRFSTFAIKPGDVLVYQVDNKGDLYDFIVTVKKFGEVINFDFTMPQKNTRANVNIQKWAVENATKYNNFFTNNNMDLPRESTVWLSKENYNDIASTTKKTTMDMGTGAEKYARGNTSVVKINYNGKEKIITIFEVESEDENSQKSLWVLTDPVNPLIVYMDLGWKITLKEVR